MISTLTIRLPEDKHQRLRELARQQGVSINRLMDELSTMALTQHDTEMRFHTLAAKGSPRAGLRILQKLDRLHGKSSARSAE